MVQLSSIFYLSIFFFLFYYICLSYLFFVYRFSIWIHVIIINIISFTRFRNYVDFLVMTVWSNFIFVCSWLTYNKYSFYGLYMTSPTYIFLPFKIVRFWLVFFRHYRHNNFHSNTFHLSFINHPPPLLPLVLLSYSLRILHRTER